MKKLRTGLTYSVLAVVYFMLSQSIWAREVRDPGVATYRLRVGFIATLTRGDNRVANAWGIQSRNGLLTALAGCRSVSLEIRDNQNSPIEAASIARELIASGVDLIVGMENSDQALMVKRETDAAGIPFLTFQSTAEKLFTPSGLTFSMGVRNQTQAERIVDYLLESYAKETAAGVGLVVARNCTFCVDLEDQITRLLNERGISITKYPDLLNRQPVPQEYLNGVRLKKVLGILTFEGEAISLLKHFRDRGFKGVVFGGDSFSAQTTQVNSWPDLVQDLCTVNSFGYDRNRQNSVNRNLRRLYGARYNEDPSDIAALSYDAGLVLKELSLRCSNPVGTSACLVQNLRKLRLEGASGAISFDENGSRALPGYLIKSSECK